MKWIKIERDKDGFTTEKCMIEMRNALPFCLLTQFNEHGIDQFYNVVTHNNVADWMGDIATNVRCTHYLPLPKLEV